MAGYAAMAPQEVGDGGGDQDGCTLATNNLSTRGGRLGMTTRQSGS